VVQALYNAPVPVIAALHGAVVGAGMSIALACDIRIAADDSYFQQAFIRLGLTPDGGSSWLLPRAVGMARAAQLTMTGETIDVRRAAEWGLVNEVVPAGTHLERARDVAARVAGFAPNAMQGLKSLLRESPASTFQRQLAAEADAQVANAGRPEFAIALRAFLARKS
jgi:enoyl-CoA hydratase/carnithine racemase